MSKVAKWIFPIAGGKEGIIGTATAVVGFMTGNWGMVASGIAQVAGAGKKSQAQARQASILQLSLGETPREAVLGMTATGGSLVDVFNFGGQYGTDKVTRCVALADHAIDGIEGFYVNDIYYPWTNEGQQAVFSNKLSFHFRNATGDGYDPPQHVQQNGGWTPADRMAGITHIWIDWYVDEKVWPQGHPEFRFVLRGLRAFDPRFDPALGYTGPNPQTWADRSSHKFTRNAKVLRYAYTRGIYAEGHHGDPDYLLIGRGLTAEEAPPELVIADANLCDEIVDGVPRYAVDAVISASQPYIEVDGLFAAAMAGEVIQRQGTVEVEAGQAKAVVVTITDDDLVIGEPVKFSDFLPDNDGGRINTVIGRYIEPSLGYRDHSAPVRRSLDHIQSDGGPREQTISLPFVTQVKQVDRIIEIRRLLSRLEKRASIVLPPKFAGLEEGDWIAWQSQRRHGGATRRYRIESYRQPETWRMYLTLREIASSVFGVPDPVEDTTMPPPPPQVIDALQLLGVEAESITLPGDTSTVPAVRFKWVAPVDPAVLAIRAEVRRVGETETAPTRTDQVNDGIMIATNGVGPDQGLEVRLVPIGDPSRPVLASNWITVSTSTIVAGDVSPDAPGLSPIKEAIAAAGEGLEQIGGAVGALNQTVYDAQTGLQVRTGQLWDDINDAADGLKVRTGALFDRLDAPGTGIEARVTDLAQTVENGDEASAERFQALEAFSAAGPNHCPNGGLADGLAGLSSSWPLVWAVSDTWGPNVAVVPSGDGTYVIEWPAFDAAEGVPYTVSGDIVLFAAGGASYFDIQFRDAAGQTVHDGARSPRGPGDFSDTFARRKAMAATTTCPIGSGAITAQVRCVFANVVNPTAMAARRVKVDFGDKPTAWSDETTEWQGASRLIDLDEVVQNPTSGLVRRTELLDSQLNTPTTGLSAQVASAREALTDLEAGKAEATDLEALEVRSRTLPNQVPNSAAAQDLYLWNGAPIWKSGYGDDVGSYFFCDTAGEHYFTSKPFPLGPNKTYSFEFEGDGGTAPSENAVYFDLLDGTDADPGEIVQFGAGARSYEGVGWFKRRGDSFTTGPTVKWGVAVVKKAAASNYVTMTRLMLNAGPAVAAWTDTLALRDLSARQSEMERVVLTPTTGLAERLFGLDSELHTPTTGIAARLGNTEQTLIDLDQGKASATDFEALESEVITPNTGLLSRMADAEGTLVDLDEGKAEASDVEDIQSAIFTPTTGISARLTQALQTAANLEQEKADVTALQQLEAITGVRENLAINGGLTEGLEGLTSNTGMVLDEDSWGRSVKLATFAGTGTRVISWPSIEGDPNTIYTVSGDALLFASDGVVYFDMIFVDAAGQTVGDGGEHPRGPGDFSNAPSRRQDMAFAQMSPSTTARIIPRCVFESVVDPTALGARMVKVERGSLPATSWSDEASAAYTAAKLAELNRVVTTPTTGLAARLEITEAEINTPGTGLKAAQQNLVEALVDLDAGKASVISMENLEAQLRTVPNRIPNSGAKFGMDRWNGAPVWATDEDADVGEYFVCFVSGEYYLVSQPFRLRPDTTYAHAFEGEGGSDPDACSVYLDLLGGTETTPGGIVQYGAGACSFADVGWFTRKGASFTTGPNVFWGQYVVKKAATTSYVSATRFMLNVGDKAAAWSDSLSERELRASIQDVREVAVSADGRSKAIVGNVLDVNGYVSGTESTNDGFQAKFEILADVFGIRSPGGGERTEYRSGLWYIYSPAEATRTVYGKAFGGDQKITWWTGPDTVAEGAETKGNAYVYISQNTVGGPRFGGADVLGPGGTLTATANTGFIGGARTGAGYVNTSNQVTVTVSGGTAGATIRWVRISGDSRIGMNDATAFNTGAGATIGVGEVISAYFMGAVTKGGQSSVVYVQVDLSDNGT